MDLVNCCCFFISQAFCCLPSSPLMSLQTVSDAPVAAAVALRKPAVIQPALLLALVVSYILKPDPLYYIRNRSDHWWEEVVLAGWDDDRFKAFFRVTRATWTRLTEKVHPFLAGRDSNFRQAIPTGKKLAIALWWLARGEDFRALGERFGLGASTVCHHVHRVVYVLSKELYPEYVYMPASVAEQDAVKAGFLKLGPGIEGVVGAVDGVHVQIQMPDNAFRDDYMCRKGFASVLAQGTCDHNGMFIDLVVGWPGSVNDARVLTNSPLYRMGNGGGLNLPGGSDSIMLGDAGYPLLNWMLVPFAMASVVELKHRVYNYRHSRTRMPIERAFGMLKARWRCLLNCMKCSFGHAIHAIKACVALHNLCRVEGDVFLDEEWMIPRRGRIQERYQGGGGGSVMVANGKTKQLQVCNHLATLPAVIRNVVPARVSMWA